MLKKNTLLVFSVLSDSFNNFKVADKFSKDGIKSLVLMALYAPMILIIWQMVVIKCDPDYIRGLVLVSA